MEQIIFYMYVEVSGRVFFPVQYFHVEWLASGEKIEFPRCF